MSLGEDGEGMPVETAHQEFSRRFEALMAEAKAAGLGVLVFIVEDDRLADSSVEGWFFSGMSLTTCVGLATDMIAVANHRSIQKGKWGT